MADNTSGVTSTVRSPGLYGRACKACASSKAKCVPSAGLDPKCQRCQRLGKLCEQSAATQRRKTDKRAGRVAKLEEKLDSLVTLLGNAPNLAAVSEPLNFTGIPSPQSSSSPASAMDAIQKSVQHDSRPLRNASGLEPRHETSVRIRGQAHLSINSPTPQLLFHELNEPRANILLDRFRNMTAYFPFVVVPQTVDARTLLRDRPYLYRAIMAAAERNADVQKDQVTEIMHYLALHTLQRGEKNLDLLLGVLVHIAWNQFHIHVMPRLTHLLHQALVLLFDLGLNRGAFGNPRVLGIDDRLYATRCHKNYQTTDRTLEERRAALGCFYLISGCASYLANIEPMKWTPYFEECLVELQNSNQYPTDSSLVKHIKMQCMMEKINASPWHDDADQPLGWTLYPPVLYIRAIKGELQALKNELQTQFSQNSGLLSHYYSVEMSLYEIGLSKAATPVTARSIDFPRLEILYSCLQSVEKFFEEFLQIPPSTYWNLSVIHFTHLSIGINMLQRLSIFEDPAWDLQYVAEKVNFVRVLNRICDNFAAALESGGAEAANAVENIHVFERTESRLRKLSASFEAQMAPVQLGSDQTGNFNTSEMMDLENMAGFWESDWFDIMGANWSGS